jgi:hypothetical protein
MTDELRVGLLPRVAFFFLTGVSLAVELTKPEANADRDL